MTEKAATKTRFAVARYGTGDFKGVFRDVPLPGGGRMRLMNPRLFEEALDSAERALRRATRAREADDSAA